MTLTSTFNYKFDLQIVYLFVSFACINPQIWHVCGLHFWVFGILFFPQDFAAYIGKKKRNHSSFPPDCEFTSFRIENCVSMYRQTKWQTCSALIIIAIYRNIHCRCSAMQAHLTGLSGFSGCLFYVFSWALWMSFFSIQIFSIQLYVLTLLNIQKHSPWPFALFCFLSVYWVFLSCLPNSIYINWWGLLL